MLLTVKIILLFSIFGVSTLVGYLISNRYSSRVKELQDLITSLELFETRINYTYDTIPECFQYIAKYIEGSVGNIFRRTAEILEDENNLSAGDCFKNIIDEERYLLNLKDVDVETIKGLSVSLGQIDLDSQIKNIRLIIHTLNNCLDQAEEEKKKNFKLYRNMGVLTGLVLMIVLI
ncbi:MAG: stage III sporulation protein AB [Clostridia bacterium]|nr:stage III sporulation protein AB [Clostridia bacterium]